MAEGAGADIRRAEATGGVVTEGPAQLAELQLRIGQFELRALGGEVDHHGRRRALLQRQIELQMTTQGPLAAPPGEGLGGAQRRLLKNLQGIAQAALQLGVELQARRLPLACARNFGQGLGHPAVQQASLGQAHPHAAVLDQHLATAFAQGRPAGLVGQLGILYGEVQAEAARCVRRPLVQRALVLEVPFIHRAAANRALQPTGQLRIEARRTGRQVFLGVACIALAQAHPQVHVVLFLGIAQQANEKIAGDLALLTDYPQVRTAQGECLLVQAPGQAGIGPAVVPGLGKQGVQVQDEVLGIQAQLALPEVAAEAAADVFRRRRGLVGGKADALEVGGELQALGTLAARPVVELDIAQGAPGLQPLEQLQAGIRQGCESGDQGRQGRQVEAIGRYQPLLLGLRAVLHLAQCHLHLAPARLTLTQRQVIEQHFEALLGAAEVGVQGQIPQAHRVALGIAGLDLRRMQARHRALHLATGPGQPELAAGLQAPDLPLRRQARRQPARPIALRQAQVQLELGVVPAPGWQLRAQLQGQRLAIRQQQAAVQALARRVHAQGQVDIGQGMRRMIAGLQRHLAV